MLRVWRVKFWAIASAGVVAAALTVLTSTASAILYQLPSGKVLSYMPTAGSPVPAPPTDAAFNNLDYNGGPVMASNKNYAIYWSPSGLSAYPTGYTDGLNQYFTDLAHDSGGNQNVDSVATQYNDLTGQHANYSATFGGGMTDTDPYPANGCSAATICLTDDQIQTELNTFITANSLPRGRTNEYFLLTPPGVESCFTGTNVCSAGSSHPFYCAYHGNTTGPNEFIYANDPFVTGISGCDDGHHPNGPSDGALLGGLSHEHNESITDPEPNNAWTDFATGQTHGFENGDKCSRALLGDSASLGPSLGTFNGQPYNQLINSNHYLYQMEWSNQTHSCLQRYTATLPLPTASFIYNGGSGNTVNFDASASTANGGVGHYSWQWNDVPGINGPIDTPFETTAATTSRTFPATGTFLVALTAFAGDGASAGSAKQVTVPSAVVSVTNPGSQTGTQGTPASLQIVASASDAGTLTYTASGLPTGLTINSSTGLISGNPTAPGTFNNVIVTATDSSGPAKQVAFSWTINPAPSGGVSVTNPGNQFGTVGTPASLQIAASAGDAGTLSYSATGLPTGLTIDPTTGLISGTPTAPGVFSVTVTATDSTGPTGQAAFTWTISSCVAIKGRGCGPTVSVTNPGNQTGIDGTPASLQIIASDSDGGTLTYSASGLPTGLTINASTGLISGTPTAQGGFNVTVTATDASGPSGQAAFSWTIDPAAGPSVSVTNPGNQTGIVNAPASLQIIASATDAGTLAYSATGLPTGLTIDPTTGLISGTPTNLGVFSVTVTATDSTGPSDQAAFTWTINPSCVPVKGRGCSPTVSVTNPGNQTGVDGTPASLQIIASDSDGGALTYSATGLPTGLTIDTNTGLISGTPSGSGVFSVTVTATDASGPSGQAAFTWTINPSGGPTVSVTNPGNQFGTLGTPVSLQIVASAGDAGTLSYSATGLPAGLTIDTNTGLISGTPIAPGLSSVTVTVTDSTGPTGQAAFSWTIINSCVKCPPTQRLGSQWLFGSPAGPLGG